MWALGCALLVPALAACGRVVTLIPARTPTAELPAALSAAAPRPTATPAPYTPPPTLSLTPSPTPVIYIVRGGDILGSIADQFGVTVAALRAANNNVDPRTLQIGQELVIPRLTATGAAVPSGELTPTPMPFEVQNVHFSHTPIGGLWVLGEILNTSADTLEQVEVGVRLLDERAETLAEASVAALLSLVPPQQVAPFAVVFQEAPKEFQSYEIFPLSGVPAYEGGYYQELAVENLAREGRRLAAYAIRGAVRNTGDATAFDVQVIVTAYDPLQRVIAIRKISPDQNVVPVGGETAFTAILAPLGGPVARVHVVAQGRRFPSDN